MTASVGSWIVGSGTFSTRTSRLPCQVTALIASRSLRQRARRSYGGARVPGRPALNLGPIDGRP
ncbi:hypothetical protein GCM10010309_06360 [Streptomyces violaceochromogenes]|nr:hypothetical protein GCM10010309_06360 [Streptomyces violaceochromogenes]